MDVTNRRLVDDVLSNDGDQRFFDMIDPRSRIAVNEPRLLRK